MTTVVGTRLDKELLQAFESFRETNELTRAQAVRILIEMGLANVNQLDQVWQNASLRQGRFEGVSRIKKTLQELLDQLTQ